MIAPGSGEMTSERDDKERRRKGGKEKDMPTRAGTYLVLNTAIVKLP